jgi:hypothetical protein
MIETVLSKLEQRLGGRLYAKQRLGIETDHEAQIFGQGLTFFHIENWYSIHSVIRTFFKLTGLYWRGRANAAHVQVRYNDVCSKKLPPAFDGFTLLHISDFHADMNDGAMRRLEKIVPNLSYDLCVLTGDYRGATFGHAVSGRARGNLIIWPATPRPGLDRQSCPCALTACRKSLCTAFGMRKKRLHQ